MSLTKFALYGIYADSLLMQAVVYVSLPIAFYFTLSVVACFMNRFCVPIYKCLVGGR